MTDHAEQRNTSSLDRRRFLGRGAGLAAVGAAAGSGLLSGCTSEKQASGGQTDTAAAGTGPQEGKKVVFVVHDNNPFFRPVQSGFELMGAMLGWQTQFTGPPKFDVQETVKMMQDAITAKPDGVIFTRADNKAFDAAITRAQDAGIKVVLSNVASDGYQELGVAFVGQDFIPAGRVCGEQVAKYAVEHTGRKEGLIVAGNISPGNSALEQRIEGIRQGVAAYNEDNGTSFTVEALTTSTDPSKAIAAIDAKWTADQDKIVGWGMSGLDHQFVAKWATNKNLVGRFAVGGFDLVQPVLDGIQAGSIDFTLGQNPWAQGWVASALLAMELDPGYPARDYDTGANIVDSSNIKAVLKRESA